jgi:hypothetical protein
VRRLGLDFGTVFTAPRAVTKIDTLYQGNDDVLQLRKYTVAKRKCVDMFGVVRIILRTNTLLIHSLGTVLKTKLRIMMRRNFASSPSACSRLVEVRLREVPVVEVRRPRRCAESREPPPTTVVPVQIYRAQRGYSTIEYWFKVMNDRRRKSRETGNSYPNGAV